MSYFPSQTAEQKVVAEQCEKMKQLYHDRFSELHFPEVFSLRTDNKKIYLGVRSQSDAETVWAKLAKDLKDVVEIQVREPMQYF